MKRSPEMWEGGGQRADLGAHALGPLQLTVWGDLEQIHSLPPDSVLISKMIRLRLKVLKDPFGLQYFLSLKVISAQSCLVCTSSFEKDGMRDVVCPPNPQIL